MLGAIQEKVHGRLTRFLFAAILVLFVLHLGFAYFPSVKADSRTPQMEGWAVIVGVSDYEFLSDLRWCDDDAIDMYNLTAPTWGASHVKLLTDADANKTNIEDAVKNWLASAEGPDDVVLFFFSGHGAWDYEYVPPDNETDGRDEYICPYDSLLTSYDNDIRDDELAEWLSVLDSGRIVVILDTCYSGGFINKTAKNEVDPHLGDLNDGFVKDLSKNGRVILTASAESEVSREDDELGHGVFSYYVIEALSELELVDANANHEISAEEVFNYAEPRTVNFTNDEQHPQMYDGYTGELPLITTATITFDTSPSVASLTVDGTTYLPSQLPVSFTWVINTTHTFNVSSMVSEICENVSVESPHPYPNNTTSTWTLTRLNATRIRVHFSYIRTEFRYDYVYILDDEGKVYSNYTGNFDDLWSVWVPGDTINVRLTSDWFIADDGLVIDELEWANEQTRYMFVSWNDGNASTSRTLTVSETETYTAIYKTQYYLTVNSPHGVPGGEGWYDNCTTAYASLDTDIVDHLNGTRRVFTYWGEDASGTNYITSDPIHMDGPKTAVANWETQHYLTVTSPYGSPTPSSGWFEAEKSINASVTSPASGPAGTRYVCTGWTGTGSVPTSGTNTSATFTINEPSNITWNWKTQYLLTVRTDPVELSPQPTREPAGETGPGGWWYDNSTSVQLTAQAVTRYAFLNWTVDTTSFSENPIIVYMDGPCEVTAHYVTDTNGPSIDTPVHEPYSPSLSEKVTVSVNVTDDLSEVREVILSYSTDEGETWTDVPMNKTTGDTYIGEIPGLPAGTSVQYKISAYDNADNNATEPTNGEYHVYQVVPEFPAWTPMLATLCIVAVVLMFFKRRIQTRPKQL